MQAGTERNISNPSAIKLKLPVQISAIQANLTLGWLRTRKRPQQTGAAGGTWAYQHHELARQYCQADVIKSWPGMPLLRPAAARRGQGQLNGIKARPLALVGPQDPIPK